MHGFGVRVTAGGNKSFILNYRTHAGRIRRLTIGEYPTYSTEVAREDAKKHRHTIDNGGDPLADRKAERGAPTFKDLADVYIEKHLPKKRHRRRRSTADHRQRCCCPRSATSRSRTSPSDDIDDLHHRITKRGKPYRANRIVALFSKMFALAIKKGWLTDNPAKGIERNAERSASGICPTTSWSGSPRRSAAYPDQHTADAVRCCCYTGASRGEVLSMTWDQIDFETGTWTKPGRDQDENGRTSFRSRPRRWQLLSKMRAEAKSISPHLFPGRDGTAPRRSQEALACDL